MATTKKKKTASKAQRSGTATERKRASATKTDTPESPVPASNESTARESATPKDAATFEKLDSSEDEGDLPCLTVRPNREDGFTCLDELALAMEKPEEYSEAQLTDILSENNLCENCKKRKEK